MGSTTQLRFFLKNRWYTQKKNFVKTWFVFNGRRYFLADLQLPAEVEAVSLSSSNAYLGTFSRDPICYSWYGNAGHKIGKDTVFHLKKTKQSFLDYLAQFFM